MLSAHYKQTGKSHLYKKFSSFTVNSLLAFSKKFFLQKLDTDSMGRRIAKKAAFLMLALCIQLLFGICCAVAAADTAGNSTQLSDEVMEQAMDIISAAEGAGLTEEAIGSWKRWD